MKAGSKVETPHGPGVVVADPEWITQFDMDRLPRRRAQVIVELAAGYRVMYWTDQLHLTLKEEPK